MACLEHNVAPTDIDLIKGASEALGAAAAPALCALAYAAFEGAGQGSCFEAHLFKQAAAESPDNPMVDRLANIATYVFKEAGILNAAGSMAVPLTTRSMAFVPDVLKVLLGGAALAGGTAGTLAYMAHRAGTTDDAKNEELRARIKYYNQIAQSLKERTATNGITES